MRHREWKKMLATTAVAAIGLLSTHEAMAATVTTLIDGTAPGYVLNGSFESGSDGSPVDWKGADGSTTLASDLGYDGNMLHRDDASPSDGGKYAAVGQSGAPTNFGIFLDTGHDLAAGQIFDLSFFHGQHSTSLGGDLDETGDVGGVGGEDLTWTLFTTTTDDDSGTVDDVLATGEVDALTSTTLTEATFNGVGSVPPGAIGERLFLSFEIDQDESDVTGFFAVDQVNLTVVPEPASLSLGLVGMAGVLIGARRRRSL